MRFRIRTSRRDPKVKGVKRFFRIPPGGIRKSNESNASAAQLIRYGMPQGCFGGPRGQACFAEFSFDIGFLREGSESQANLQ